MKKLLVGFASMFVTLSAFASEQKETIVLVHGAFQNAHFAWKNLSPDLKKRGLKVIEVDLPGRSGDQTPPEKLSLDAYRDHVLKAIENETSPVVLLGHSFGGFTISSVAEAHPEKVKGLIYLSAYLPKSGDSLQSLSKTDKDSDLGKEGNFQMSPDYKYAWINNKIAGAAFASDGSAKQQNEVGKKLIKEPLAPLSNVVTLTPEKFGKAKKYFIETTQDRIVSPYLQQKMVSDSGQVKKILQVEAGHAAAYTQPHKVAQAILDILKELQ